MYPLLSLVFSILNHPTNHCWQLGKDIHVSGLACDQLLLCNNNHFALAQSTSSPFFSQYQLADSTVLSWYVHGSEERILHGDD